MSQVRGIHSTASLLNGAILALVSVIGVAAFAYPFFQPALAPSSTQNAFAHAQDAPLMFVVIVVLCLGAVLGNLVVGKGMNAKMIAALGVLTAVNAVLRAVPGPAGFSAMFALPILTGYCYGPTFGYLLGTLSLAVSALLGAGIGPWLPYQMFTIGWVGLTSAWLANARHIGTVRRHAWIEIALLCGWGLVWGMAYGLVMNVWFWPFVFEPSQGAMYWQSGLGPLEAAKRYLVFYAVTSWWWDIGRSAGTALLIALFGAPILRLLRRFGRRFTFQTSQET